VATRDLVLGHVVLSADLTVVTRYTSQVSGTALARRADAVGRVITLSVASGAPVLARNVGGRGAGDGALIPPGRRIVRVPDTTGLDPAPGSVVDVLATARDGTDAGAAAVVASGALVIEGDRAATTTRSDSGVATTTRDADPGVALLMPADDAPRVASALANGQVVLALAPPEDVCCAAP
jgi:Flp pilus assembly protein CpaB